jgi:hypothetical protein
MPVHSYHLPILTHNIGQAPGRLNKGEVFEYRNAADAKAITLSQVFAGLRFFWSLEVPPCLFVVS